MGSALAHQADVELYRTADDFGADALIVAVDGAALLGGEIRLAYESDGTTSHPTTSGSLSARYDDVLKNLTFSKETQQLNNRVVPCAVLLRDVTVAGE